MKKLISILFVFASLAAYAAEESLDLDAEATTVKAKAPAAHGAGGGQKFSIMGRVDLSTERVPEEQTDVKNNHFLLFLKVKASEKVSFMGEFVTQSFFHVDYKQSDLLTVNFGKLIVPFGDTRYFHHFYGGIQGYGAQGVMFPNIWAEPGANLNFNLSPLEIDFFWVNAITAGESDEDPDFQDSTTERQALGLRATMSIAPKLTAIVSSYGGEYWPGRMLYIGGADVYSDYGLFGFSKIRVAAGIANSWIQGSPTGRNYQKRGDYVQISTNLIDPMEWRVRYGTYEHDDREETQEDSQSLNIGTTFPVDVLKVLIEHQFNYEDVNEINNDMTRAMVSLDF